MLLLVDVSIFHLVSTRRHHVLWWEVDERDKNCFLGPNNGVTYSLEMYRQLLWFSFEAGGR